MTSLDILQFQSMFEKSNLANIVEVFFIYFGHTHNAQLFLLADIVDHMGCHGSNLCQLCAREISYALPFWPLLLNFLSLIVLIIIDKI